MLAKVPAEDKQECWISPFTLELCRRIGSSKAFSETGIVRRPGLLANYVKVYDAHFSPVSVYSTEYSLGKFRWKSWEQVEDPLE